MSKYWLVSLAIVLSYVATGYLGLQMSAVGTNVTLMWLPTGIAVAFLYRCGYRYWPAVSLASVCVNLAVGSSLSTGLGIAIGNTAAPLLTTLLLQRWRFNPRFEAVSDIALLSLAAHIGMLISASNGVLVLTLSGSVTGEFLTAWLCWWAGDSMGVIAAAPLLLVACRREVETIRERYLEFACWHFLTMLVAGGVFILNDNVGEPAWALAFLPLPLIAWASMRFGATGTSLAIIIVSFAATYGTSIQSGPFYRPEPIQQITMLWIYMATTATLGWLIAALHCVQLKVTGLQRLLERGLGDAAVGFLLTDSDRRITYANAGFTRLTGYSIAELAGKDCRLLQGSETDRQTINQFNAAMDSNGHFDGEILNYRKDGTAFWNALLISPILNDRGARVGFLGIQRDITAKKEAESALQQSEMRLRTILELEPECVKIVSTDGCLVEMNPAGLEMIEADSLGQVLGTRLETLIENEHRPLFREMHSQVLAGGNGSCEFSIIGLKGTRRWLESRAVPYRDAEGTIIGQLGVTRDLTARWKAENLLKQSRDRLKGILNSIQEVVYSLTPNSDAILFISEHCEAIYGLPQAAFENDSMLWLSLVHPEDKPLAESTLAMLQEQGSFAVEYRVVRPDGEMRWVLDRGRFVLDESGTPIRLDGVVSDISERRRAEEQLRASELRYRELFKNNPQPMWVYDLETLRFLAVNNAAVQHYGYSRDEFLAMTIKDIRPAYEIPSLLKNIANVNYGLDKAGIWRHQTRAGNMIQVEITSHYQEFNGRRAELVLAYDVTERQRLEEQIYASQQRFQAIVERSHDMILIFDRDGIIRFANPASREVLGYEPEEMIGQCNLSFVIPADRDRNAQESPTVNEKMRGEFRSEIRTRHKDGNWRTLEAVGVDLLDVPALAGLVVNCRDITERKERELRTLNERAFFERLTTGASLHEMLKVIAEGSELLTPGMMCSILLLDESGQHVQTAAAPSLPESYCRAINGLTIGPQSGSCGTAAFNRERVISPSIETDPLWVNYRDLALSHGLRACWSIPMISSQGRVLGTLAMYYSEPRMPTKAELETIERATHFAVVAVERHEMLESLRDSQIRLETLVSNLPGMAYRCHNDPNWTMTYVSSGCESVTGYGRAELEHNNRLAYAEIIHPEDRDWLWSKCQVALDSHVPCSNTYRIIDKDGDVRWVQERSSGVYGDDGALRCIDGFIQDITDARRIDEQVRASLREKEAMLKEIHHRVKNNLQIVTSLLNLQVDKMTDPIVIGALRESQNRVRSMALVHETLYLSGNLGRINLAEYIHALSRHLFRSYGVDSSRIHLVLNVASTSLDLDRALPFGLIINELMSNSLKYAFPDGRSGKIAMSLLKVADGCFELVFSDDGVGFADPINIRKIGSLGLQLVRDLIQQMSGTLETDSGQGATFQITFPISNYEQETHR